MIDETFPRRFGGPVGINVCRPCQVFWFDTYESLQLSPGAILTLFKIIGEEAARGRPIAREAARCPRCPSRLLLTHDLQRNTHFQYWRCPNGHGRLVPFYDFLREKDFIKPLSPLQVAELRASIQSVDCSNCGAPIDLATSSQCAHCGTPLSMLDWHQAGRLIAALQRAEQPDGSPAVSEGADDNTAEDRDTSLAAAGLDRDALGAAGSTDLVGVGLNAIRRRLETA